MRKWDKWSVRRAPQESGDGTHDLPLFRIGRNQRSFYFINLMNEPNQPSTIYVLYICISITLLYIEENHGTLLAVLNVTSIGTTSFKKFPMNV